MTQSGKTTGSNRTTGVQAVLERAYPGARAQLKRRILLGALSCFNEHGIEATTIEQILGKCEASVGNLYHHFGSKEGLVAALFFCTLADQASLVDEKLGQARTAQEGVAALVCSYVDWVTAQPELARFMFQARSAVAKGPHGRDLQQRNRERARQVMAWFGQHGRRDAIKDWPPELLPSLLIGPSENYCRAWLAGRVKATPSEYRSMLAQAAWASVGV
jgi:AcrR family transcriptional regulator